MGVIWPRGDARQLFCRAGQHALQKRLALFQPEHLSLQLRLREGLPVDVLTAGFPCQPFSHAGKRLGANDERHLWPHIAQAIDALRPRLALLENVRGLLSAQGEPDPAWVAELADRAAHWQAVI
ncbi:MAG TPA: DNA cytosine methyltransferase, partial [Anaerolineae bacterium]|nr:DNA cytosine methyltransferase [Anaerolineae bacterium]